jgi:hypothetical protein
MTACRGDAIAQHHEAPGIAFGLVIVKAHCGPDRVGAAEFALGAVDHATADAKVDAIAAWDGRRRRIDDGT